MTAASTATNPTSFSTASSPASSSSSSPSSSSSSSSGPSSTQPSLTSPCKTEDATIYNFKISTNPPNLLNSTIQLTITSRNPNDKISIFYDRLFVYATYADQQITLPTALPSDYQRHNEVNVWSPFIFGTLVPVAPYNAVALAQDQRMQMVELVIKMDGRVRFKLGAFITGRYHLDVRCPARITFGSRSTGVQVGDGVKYQLTEKCSVSI